jgi:hypothetical protein
MDRTENLLITVAAPFRHLRKERLQKSEFIFYLTIDRMWMSRDQAALLLQRAEDDGLIRISGGLIEPLFVVASVTAPLGFKPTMAVFEEQDPYQVQIERITRATGRSGHDVAAEVATLVHDQFDGHLSPEAGLVILSRRYNIPVGDMLASLRASARNGRKKVD